MTLKSFRNSLSDQVPPAGLSTALEALWYDAKGDWGQAHELAQALDDRTGARVHAYLHRKEGDLSNAAYWYRRAGTEVAEGPLEREWERIAQELLGKKEGGG